MLEKEEEPLQFHLVFLLYGIFDPHCRHYYSLYWNLSYYQLQIILLIAIKVRFLTQYCVIICDSKCYDEDEMRALWNFS